jgi:hypothetical protein
MDICIEQGSKPFSFVKSRKRVPFELKKKESFALEFVLNIQAHVER